MAVGIKRIIYLDLSFHVFNCVTGLHLQSDGLSCQSLDKNLHSSSEPENQVEGGLLLDVVVWQGPAILQLLSSKDKSLLIRWNALLVLKKKELFINEGLSWKTQMYSHISIKVSQLLFYINIHYSYTYMFSLGQDPIQRLFHCVRGITESNSNFQM